MNKYIEIFSPLIFTAIIIPLFKIIFNENKCFFSRSHEEKIEAIDFILKYKQSTRKLEQIKNEMIISKFGLHKDLKFTTKIIYFHEDSHRNEGASRTLLTMKGLYNYSQGIVTMSKMAAFAMFVMCLIGTMMIFWGMIQLFSEGVGFAHTISYSLAFIMGALYVFFSGFVVNKYLKLVLSLKRFNAFDKCSER